MKRKKIILGTVQFGLAYGINNSTGKSAEEEFFRTLNHAAENGIVTLDTADSYGNATELIGHFHKANKYRFSINTKFRITRDKTILSQLEHSLYKLYTNHIDTYFYHSFTDMENNYDSINELIELRLKKRINKIGVSVYGNDQLLSVINNKEIDVIQLPFNLLDNNSQREELLQFAKQNGKELQVRSVFLQGLFFKSVDTFPEFLLPLVKYITKLKELGKKYQTNIQSMAMGYVMAQKLIDKVIIGVENKEQLQKNISLIDEALSESLIMEIDEIDVKEKELLLPNNWR